MLGLSATYKYFLFNRKKNCIYHHRIKLHHLFYQLSSICCTNFLCGEKAKALRLQPFTNILH